MNAVALAVEQELDLDVARPLEESLEDDSIVAECGLRLATRTRQRLVELGEVADDPHALAAAPGRRLDEQRSPDLGRRGRDGLV